MNNKIKNKTNKLKYRENDNPNNVIKQTAPINIAKV